jgi:hypothetical protein
MRGKKQKRNLAGLRNQPKLASLPLDNSQAPPPSRSADPSSAEDDDPAWELCERDSLRPNWEESDESVHEDDGDVECIIYVYTTFDITAGIERFSG